MYWSLQVNQPGLLLAKLHVHTADQPPGKRRQWKEEEESAAAIKAFGDRRATWRTSLLTFLISFLFTFFLNIFISVDGHAHCHSLRLIFSEKQLKLFKCQWNRISISSPSAPPGVECSRILCVHLPLGPRAWAEAASVPLSSFTSPFIRLFVSYIILVLINIFIFRTFRLLQCCCACQLKCRCALALISLITHFMLIGPCFVFCAMFDNVHSQWMTQFGTTRAHHQTKKTL